MLARKIEGNEDKKHLSRTNLSIFKPTSSQPPLQSIEEKIAENPVGFYLLFRKRLGEQGALASFPEFKESVGFLEKALEKPDVIKLCKEHKSLEHSRFLIKNELFHLKVTFKIDATDDYPHVPPFTGPYPYLATIIGIQNALGFLDACVRTNYDNVSPLHHSNRYFYHLYGLYEYDPVRNPIILFPTPKELSLMHFIKTRSVPIGFLGVTDEPIFGDGYFNSPLDFFLHDVNHIRRYKSHNNQFLKKISCTGLDMYKQFDNFIKKSILQDIKISEELTTEEKYIRQIMQVIYFELMHEYALTPDRESFIAAYKHKPEAPSPFEHMVDENFDPKQLETLRMKNNNLKTGFREVGQDLKKVIIRYFFDKGPNFLTSVYNKIINGFYDTHLGRSADLPPYPTRTPELVARAAERVLLAIKAEKIMSYDEILKLVTTKGFIEIYPGKDLLEPVKTRSLHSRL